MMNEHGSPDHVLFCNDGSGPLRVPGVLGVDLRTELPFEHRFSTPFDISANPFITAREIAVLRAINVITDKANWDAVVLQQDAEQLAAWQAEARATSELIDQNAWNWILREVRDKAEALLSTGLVLVFDTGATGIPIVHDDDPRVVGFSVCKSDTTVTTALAADLQQGTACFFSPPKKVKPGLSYQVDPSMFPLAFNRTPVLTGAGEFVTLQGRVCSESGRGHIAPAALPRGTGRLTTYPIYDEGHSTVFQWLPCEVEFRENGDMGITSYINNLHAAHFWDLYHTIEKVISSSIEPWNQVLVKAGQGRTPVRIHTFGVEYSPRRLYRNLPWVQNVDLLDNAKERAVAVDYIEKYLALPGQPQSPFENEWKLKDRWGAWREHWRGPCNFSLFEDILFQRWSQLRTCEEKHPRMGQALSYDAWKTGASGACVIPPMECDDIMATSIPDYDFQPLSVDLQSIFRDKGLQVVIKLASIELTPAEPIYAGGDWTIEGVRNEHIVAVSVLYYGVENVSDVQIAFRHDGGLSPCCYDYDEGDFEDLAEVMALDTGDVELHDNNGLWFEGGQCLGSVAARQGRLLSYPNHLQSRMEAFQLQDKTKPGHVRSLVLCLVDPHYRICSTRNVAPQQQEEWFDEALPAVVPRNIALPQEITQHIFEYAEGWPMSTDEAIELSGQHRKTPKLGLREMWGLCDC